MADCLLGLGANLGDRRATLDDAVAFFQTHTQQVIASRWYTYPAVGGPAGQQDFLNGAIRLQTELEPDQLAALCRHAEQQAGRQRIQRWAARTLDCDVLFYDQQIIQSKDLQVPHPRMITRRFVLEPAAEIAGDIVHPVFGWTVQRLFQHLRSAAARFAVLGSDADRRQQIARALRDQFADLSPAQIHDGWPQAPQEAAALKLLLVTDPFDSALGQRLRQLPAAEQIPALHLSESWEHAVQDAVGAVQGMTETL